MNIQLGQVDYVLVPSDINGSAKNRQVSVLKCLNYLLHSSPNVDINLMFAIQALVSKEIVGGISRA